MFMFFVCFVLGFFYLFWFDYSSCFSTANDFFTSESFERLAF